MCLAIEVVVHYVALSGLLVVVFTITCSQGVALGYIMTPFQGLNVPSLP
jgi:hypothetical protein